MSSNADSKGIIGAATGAERRRSSAGSGKFSGLMNQKRTSIDASADARKASFADQKRAPGIIGSMWSNFTKGSGSSGASAGAK